MAFRISRLHLCKKELGKEIDIQEVKEKVKKYFEEVFEIELINADSAR